MKFVRFAIAAALMTLPMASPSLAQLVVRDGNGAVQRTCEVTDATGIYHTCNVAEAISAGLPTQLYAEADHSLDVTIKTSPDLTAAQLTAAGLALHSDMTFLNAVLGSPMQAGGYIGNSYFLEDCMAVSADQAFTVGTQQHCTMTTTGRIKVGLSSAATIGQVASTTADLAGAVDPSGNQQGLHQDGSFNLKTVDTNSAAGLTAAQAAKADLDALVAAPPLTNGGTVNTVVAGTPADRGGAISTGGSAQSFLASNSSRRGWVIQNQSNSYNLYVNCSTTATQDYHSLLIQPGQLYETSSFHVSIGACSIIGSNTGQTFYAREF